MSYSNDNRLPDSTTLHSGTRNPDTETTELPPPTRRLLIAGGVLIALAGLATIAYLLGMIFLMFAGEGGDSAKIPAWLEASMLVGCPILLGFCVLLIPLLIAVGLRWRWVIVVAAGCVVIVFATYGYAFVTMIRSTLD